MDLQSILTRAKDTMKRLQQMQMEYKQRIPVEKLTFPHQEEPVQRSNEIQTVDISTKSVAWATIVIIAILALTYFLYEIR